LPMPVLAPVTTAVFPSRRALPLYIEHHTIAKKRFLVPWLPSMRAYKYGGKYHDALCVAPPTALTHAKAATHVQRNLRPSFALMMEAEEMKRSTMRAFYRLQRHCLSEVSDPPPLQLLPPPHDSATNPAMAKDHEQSTASSRLRAMKSSRSSLTASMARGRPPQAAIRIARPVLLG
jgi:hypothetical protein